PKNECDPRKTSTDSNFLNISKLYGNITNENINPRPSVNSKILSLSKFQQNNESNPDSTDAIGTVSYKCETLLNIFTEIWLNHFSQNIYEDKQLKMALNNFNISTEHMKVIRVFVKHLHYFANSYKKK